MKSKSSKCLPKSAIYGIAGKTPIQVQRRNERERRRVQAVNNGYENLAKQVKIFKLIFTNYIFYINYSWPVGKNLKTKN